MCKGTVMAENPHASYWYKEDDTLNTGDNKLCCIIVKHHEATYLFGVHQWQLGNIVLDQSRHLASYLCVAICPWRHGKPVAGVFCNLSATRLIKLGMMEIDDQCYHWEDLMELRLWHQSATWLESTVVGGD
ncbi:uncharacterized protein G2W53_034964 [Senna tora]|uniref:Uncharacterized protein n=1 Tax=Senna tora TaxID=362788 RepID=A0A834W724_9FABA|nr:uncharacterized protein G2W53_034964 [Senna tora]